MELGYKGEVIINFINDECRLTEDIFRSLYAEVVNPVNIRKLKAYISIDKCSIKINVVSDKMSHLRAFVNSILYLLNTAIEVIQVSLKIDENNTMALQKQIK
jgi:tRNA threonylcarbamoyladenosine modification (KEOPS) complex  Pcc1 subunit